MLSSIDSWINTIVSFSWFPLFLFFFCFHLFFSFTFFCLASKLFADASVFFVGWNLVNVSLFILCGCVRVFHSVVYGYCVAIFLHLNIYGGNKCKLCAIIEFHEFLSLPGGCFSIFAVLIISLFHFMIFLILCLYIFYSVFFFFSSHFLTYTQKTWYCGAFSLVGISRLL